MVQSTAINPYEALGFTVPDPASIPRRVIASIAGFEKVGKSFLAYTGRPPLVVINLDVGDEGVIEQFKAQGKDVYIYNIPLVRPTSIIEASEDAGPAMWKQQWSQLNTTLEQVYRLNPGTVVIDTMTEAYELARLAHFGKLTQVMPHQYTMVQSEVRSMVRMAYAAEQTSTVFIHKMGYNFDSKLPEIKGYNQMPFMVQANLENYKMPNPAGYGIDTFYSKIKDCRQNPHTNGMVLDGANFSLEYLEWLIHGWRPE
jgi:hypothetical protein